MIEIKIINSKNKYFFYSVIINTDVPSISIKNQDGEGCIFGPSDFYEEIDKFFKETF